MRDCDFRIYLQQKVKACLLTPLIFSFSFLGGCSKPSLNLIPAACASIQSPCLTGKAIVEINTNRGRITLEIDGDAAPVTSGNFIDLISKGVYEGTVFHRVVKDFIIQGGNSDSYEISKRRRNIGRYLLPPDTKKGYKHHRGVISMPSSEIENPHKLASPYEFFIVQKSPGAYHLDGNYTVFGKVIKGMDVVDKINKQKTDNRETPLTNVFMEVSILE